MNCMVITPVGPGHETLASECRMSVERAALRGLGPFAEVHHAMVDDSQGLKGRSRARNEATHLAAPDAEWLFFLDADDLLAEDAFLSAAGLLDEVDALWGLISELPPDGMAPEPRMPQVISMSLRLELAMLDPFTTLQMGHFVRSAAALNTPFDESADCGEDFDYYFRLWDSHACAKKPMTLFHNRRGLHSTGPRAADGHAWRRRVETLQLHWLAAWGATAALAESIVEEKSIEFARHCVDHGLAHESRLPDCLALARRAFPSKGIPRLRRLALHE